MRNLLMKFMVVTKTSVKPQKDFKSKYRRSNWMRLMGIWLYSAVSQMWAWLWTWSHLFYCWKKCYIVLNSRLWFLLSPCPPKLIFNASAALFIINTEKNYYQVKLQNFLKCRDDDTTHTVSLLFICLRKRPDTHSWWM